MASILTVIGSFTDLYVNKHTQNTNVTAIWSHINEKEQEIQALKEDVRELQKEVALDEINKK